MNNYYTGTAVRLTGTFKVNSIVTDPTTVTLRIKKGNGEILVITYDGEVIESASPSVSPSASPSVSPSGVAENVSTGVIRHSKGVYYYDVTVDVPGPWAYRFEGTGAAQATDEERFNVPIGDFRQAGWR
jgi:hypothetical protein